MTGDGRWAVRLTSRHTGLSYVLGMRYATREEAEAHATDEQVCHRCNSVSVEQAMTDYRPVREQLGINRGR